MLEDPASDEPFRDDRPADHHEFEGLSFDEIAVRVGRNNASTVRAIHRRAKQVLCEELAGFA